MRAVVVLLLLIANAIVASRNSEPAASAPVRPTDDSPRLLATVDGASPVDRPGVHDGGCVSLPLNQMHL